MYIGSQGRSTQFFSRRMFAFSSGRQPGRLIPSYRFHAYVEACTCFVSYSCRADSHGLFLTPDRNALRRRGVRIREFILRGLLWDATGTDSFLGNRWLREFLGRFLGRWAADTCLQISRISTCNFIIAAVLLVRDCARIKVDSGRIYIYIYARLTVRRLRVFASGSRGVSYMHLESFTPIYLALRIARRFFSTQPTLY